MSLAGGPGADVLDVGTGSGYGCAALAHRLGERHVTSVDAIGRVEWDRAGFMPTRAGADYPPTLKDTFAIIREADGEQVRNHWQTTITT